MISLVLDAWTSSNNYAFLAIIAHYINKKGELGEHNSLYFNLNTDLTLEELLIDFCELVGEHSGKNMAEAVWETLTCYGIQDQVSFICQCEF